MLDQYNRTIEYIRISVTDRCNLRCRYCMPAEGVEKVPHEEIITYKEIVRIASVLTTLGINRIKLTGGEPLVRRNLAGLVRELKALPGVEQVTVTTNGVLLGDQIADLAAAGIDAVNISLDSMDPDYFHEVTRIGNIDDVLRSLEVCRHYPDVRFKINCVPVGTVDEKHWLSVAELSKDGPFDVRYIEMMPIGIGKESNGVTEERLRERLDALYGTPSVETGRLGNGPAKYVRYPGFASRIGFISAVSHKFCDTCNRVRLTSTGMLKPCLQFSGGADLRFMIRSGADDETLREIMQKTIYMKPEGHLFGERNTSSGHCHSGFRGEDMEMKKMSEIGG